MDFFGGASPTPNDQLYDKTQLTEDHYLNPPKKEITQPETANNEEKTEQDLLNEYREPLKEFDQPEPENTDEKSIIHLFEEPKIDTEDLKRIGKLNKVSAKGIVKLIDGAVSFGACQIAQSDEIDKYAADEDALDDLSGCIDEMLPKSKTFIPTWGQVVIFALLAFLPVFLMAFSDRKKNKALQAERAKNRSLKMKNRELKHILEGKELEKSIRIKEQELIDREKEIEKQGKLVDQEAEQYMA